MNHYQGAEEQNNSNRAPIAHTQHPSMERQKPHQRQQQHHQHPEISPAQPPHIPTTQQTAKPNRKFPNAQVRIVEQPANKAIRFRYECERRSAGSIIGVNSTAILKTYPTIEVMGYKGRGVAVVSCVTKDAPYRPHPYSLTGKEGCRKGVCTVEINSGTMRYVFNNLGIQCVKKKDITEALKLREEIRVDPFKTGFAHRAKIASIDLNALRLCFQVFIEDDNGRFTIPLPPVISEPIVNRNSTSELVITEMCSSGTVLGNTQIMLLCEKVSKDDIAVRFFELKDGVSAWEAYGNFLPADVHKQTSIRLKIPRYHNIYITEAIKVFVQLQRPSDGEVSEPWQFTYKPLDTNLKQLRRKYLNGKGPGVEPMQQPQKQISPPSQLDLVEPLMDTKNVPPVNATEICPMSGQMTPSPQPTSPPTFSYPIALTSHNKINNDHTPPKSPHEEFHMDDRNCGVGIPMTLTATSDARQGLEVQSAYGGVQQMHQQPLESTYVAHRQQQQQNQDQQTKPQPQPPNAPQQQPLQQQQPQQQQQQNYTGYMYYNAHSWDEGYANILRDVNNGNLTAFTATALNNFYNSNNYLAMQNMLGCATTAATAAAIKMETQPPAQWNFPSNANTSSSQVTQWQQWSHNQQQTQQQQQRKLHQQQSQQQQKYAPPQQVQQHFYQQNLNLSSAKMLGQPKGGYEKYAVNNHNNAGEVSGRRTTTISNLLNLDSDELVKVTSEDQEMMQFGTEELQLSNLYIST